MVFIETAFQILFAGNGMAASCLKVQQMGLVNNVCSILPPNFPSNFISKYDLSPTCKISSETRSTKRIVTHQLAQLRTLEWQSWQKGLAHYLLRIGLGERMLT